MEERIINENINGIDENFNKTNENIDDIDSVSSVDDSSGIVKFCAIHVRDLFPKAPAVLGEGSDTYGITVWTVIRCLEGDVIENRHGEVTVTGTFSYPIQDKMRYIITARQVRHPQYGIQYKLMYLNMDVDFSHVSGQKAFLRVFLSAKQIEEFYKIYENPLEIIDSHNIEALKKVHGVGDYIARCIIRRYEENKDMSMVYMELDKYDLTPTMVDKLIRHFKNGNLLVNTVKFHPYELVKIDGIGFITADEIALKSGMSPTDWERVRAYILYYLKEEGENGNSYVSAGELLGNIYDFFGGKDEITEIYYDENGEENGTNITKAINNLVEDGIIVIEEGPNKSRRRIYLQEYWILEKKIAYHLRRLMYAQNNFKYEDWQEKVKKLEARQGFEFAEEQIKGIKMGLDNQVCLISGLAGSGKSSLVSGILASLNNYSFAQCALSGKAAARLQEVTGKEGQTIHRLLSYKGTGFGYNRFNGLPYDIIVLDEISLVGGQIFLNLLEAIKDGCKLIMLGDMGQLESIGALNLAADIVKSELIPTIELKEIHRQAAKSGIITCSHDIRNQVPVFEKGEIGKLIYGELEDMIFDVAIERDNIRKTCIEYFKQYWDSDIVNHDIMKIQILSPIKERGESCVFTLNLDIQNIVNPIDDRKHKIKVNISKEKSFYIQEGDKVMCIKNNYKTTNRYGENTPIFNGWTGIVTNIIDLGIWVDFPLGGGEIFIDKADIKNELALGYASTIHKSQGSDYPVVIGAIDFSTPPSMLTCQLVYTLVTRAKKMCVLVCQSAAVLKAISSNYVSTKRTFLEEFLVRKYFELDADREKYIHQTERFEGKYHQGYDDSYNDDEENFNVDKVRELGGNTVNLTDVIDVSYQEVQESTFEPIPDFDCNLSNLKCKIEGILDGSLVNGS